MRMRDFCVTAGGMGIQWEHVVTARLSDPIPKKPDLERSQVDLFQNNPVGRNREKRVPQVDLKRGEFLFQAGQLFVDLAQGSNGRSGLLGDGQALHLTELFQQLVAGRSATTTDNRRGCVPAASVGQLELMDQ